MIIECNEINQVINELKIAFADCKEENLLKMVELIAAVNTCNNGGPNYDVEISDVYEPEEDLVVTYPLNTYHSISIMVLEGNITQTISSTTVVYPQGTVLNTEVTTLNQTPTIFTVTAGSKVIVKYLIESD